MEAFHANGQAKYLEEPARLWGRWMADMVQRTMKKGQTLTSALALAGNFLLSKAKELVPVDTGFLKASGFVKVERES